MVAEPIKPRVTKMTDLYWPCAIQRHFRDVMYTKPSTEVLNSLGLSPGPPLMLGQRRGSGRSQGAQQPIECHLSSVLLFSPGRQSFCTGRQCPKIALTLVPGHLYVLCFMFYVYLEGTSSRSTAYRKKRGLVYTADVSEKRSRTTPVLAFHSYGRVDSIGKSFFMVLCPLKRLVQSESTLY